MPVERITLFCFAASYATALFLELLFLLRSRSAFRVLGIGFGAAGLLAHSLYLLVQRPSPSSQFGSLLVLGWVLAIFYLAGTIHHRGRAWAVFSLPLVLGLVAFAAFFSKPASGPGGQWLPALWQTSDERFWAVVHGGLLLLAAVGVCVGFLASVMYLVQARRLKAKALPGQGLPLLSLERLETMNRRAINLAFPLLTAGVLVGVLLMVQDAERLAGWTDPRVLSAAVLWVVFALLLYLRYGFHLRGRRAAMLTIATFALLLFTLALPHWTGRGGGP